MEHNLPLNKNEENTMEEWLEKMIDRCYDDKDMQRELWAFRQCYKELKKRQESGQVDAIVISDALKEKIFSDELNQRITAAVNDNDYPNKGSIIAGLVQEEIFNYLTEK